MAKAMKEFKITCQGCGNVRFFSYFNFKNQTTTQKYRVLCRYTNIL